MNLVSELSARAASHPDRVALIQGKQKLTFAELNDAVAAGGADLKRHGLQPGDRVLLLVSPGIELYPILLAIFHAGLVAVLFDPAAKRSAIRRFLEDFPLVAFIGAPKAHLLRLLFAPLRRVPHIFHTGRLVPFSQRWRPQPIDSRDTEPHPVDNDFPALVTFTSGGTGAPKAASRSHGFLLEQHHAVATALEYKDSEIDLSTLPIFTLATLASGLTSLIPSSAHPKVVHRECLTHKVTRCAASPGFFLKLHQADAFPPFERIHTGGAPVFPDFLRNLEKAHPSTLVTIVYGSTEAEPISHIDWHSLSEADHQAMQKGKGMPVGRPVDAISLRILAPSPEPLSAKLTREEFDRLTLAPGEIGEIIVSGDHVLKGYLDPKRDIETKLHVDRETWHRTGDAGWIDEQGRLWLVGRCSASIHRPGTAPIYPFGIECAARIRCGISTCALVDHKEMVTLVCEGSENNELASHIRQEFPQIEQVLFLSHIPLDRRHNAKIDYPALEKLLEA